MPEVGPDNSKPSFTRVGDPVQQERQDTHFGSAEADDAVDGLRRRLDTGSRIMLGLVGAPGSGKSTLAARLQEYFTPSVAAVVPMDGFHFGNTILNGTDLKDRKGAIDTFDIGGYVSILERLKKRAEPVVYVPDFHRNIDEPIAASIAVPADVPLVITEGNYLLANEEPWRRVHQLLDEVWFVQCPPALRMSRLIERHIAFGLEPAAAKAWAAGPDQANARMIETTRGAADRTIVWL